MIYLVSRQNNLFSPENYTLISADDALEQLSPLQRVQLDTETMGLDCHTKELLTIQLGGQDVQVVFDWTTLTKEEKNKLKQYLESDRLFIGHNLMFDLTFLYVQDIWPINIYDTMVAEQLLCLGYPRVLTVEQYSKCNLPEYELVETQEKKKKKIYYELKYSLQATAKRRINTDIDKSVRGKIVNDGLTEQVVVYAAGDVMWLEDIMDAQYKVLAKEDLIKAAEFECEFVKSLAYVKYCGVHLDVSKWKQKMENDKSKLEQAKKELDDWVLNWDVNKHYTDSQGDLFLGFQPRCTVVWSSSKQVTQLFEEIGINVETVDRKTGKKKKSVEEKQLVSQINDFPIIPIFLRYQAAAKLVSTYGQNWLNAVNPKTGRIHVELHSVGTDTSRVSSGGGQYKLNQQNLPHDPITRACFTAEKGNKWLSADYSSQESCITASISKDSKMCDILNNGGDLHCEVAKSCWPDLLGNLTVKEIKEKYKDKRQDAKGIEFKIFYGGSDDTLGKEMGFSKSEAKRIYDNFMSNFTGIKGYQNFCRQDVMRKGYILMNTTLKHRAHIHDVEWLFKVRDMVAEDGFWGYYHEMRKSYPSCETVTMVREYNKRRADIERHAINYRMD